MLALRHNGSRHCWHSQLVDLGDLDMVPLKNHCKDSSVKGDSASHQAQLADHRDKELLVSMTQHSVAGSSCR